MALRRSALGDTIFSEESFMYGEDVELCERLRRAGLRVVYTPRATVVHHHGGSIRQQSGAVLLSGLRGLRAQYVKGHGEAFVGLYDVLTATGFLLRWGAYGVMTMVRPGRGYGPRAVSSREHMARAFQIMFGK